MTAQIVVGPQREVQVFLAMRCGERHADNAANIAGRQPSLLVVVRPVELPTVILRNKKLPMNNVN